MAIGIINFSRGEYKDNGLSPRQRKMYILRWNPSISPYRPEEYAADFKNFNNGPQKILWNVYDWKSVEYMDLFVMVMVGKGHTGIMGAGYLHSYPQVEVMPDGTDGKTVFFNLSYNFMQYPEKTGLLTGESLCNAIPDVDWMHGHSGELINVEQAERLALYMVKTLKDAKDGEFLKFENYSQKEYVLSDIMTFLCPSLKRELLAMGKNLSPEITDINNLAVCITDEDYGQWNHLEDHLELEKISCMML